MKVLVQGINENVESIDIEYIHNFISANVISDQIRLLNNVKSLKLFRKNE